MAIIRGVMSVRREIIEMNNTFTKLTAQIQIESFCLIPTFLLTHKRAHEIRTHFGFATMMLL
jgi:hypothetical protein